MVKRVWHESLMPVHWSVVLTVILFVLLIGTAVWRFKYAPDSKVEAYIVQDLTTLATVFKKIDNECTIIGIKHQRDYIDFLNVISFVGSEIGPINLAYPDKWKGPYLKENPTIQGKLYQIIHTHQGYFIAPGDGVTLSNGKTVGKDILFDENADLKNLSCQAGALSFEGKPLVVALPVSRSVFDDMLQENVLLVEDSE